VEITEVRIKLMEDAGERLQGFCSITFDDCFVVRDLKVIEGTSGPFVAMPSRKLTAHCPQCGSKNHLRAGYCNQCGLRLSGDRFGKDDEGRAKLYADIAHPINSNCRELIQERVIRAFRDEVERSKQPGYVSSYDDFEEETAAACSSSRRQPERKPAAATGERIAAQKEPLDRPTADRPSLDRPPLEKHAAMQPAAERTKVQPAATEPRAPHKVPARQGSSKPANSSGFGAGIW
jgi:stage V sporulation protein G